MNQTDSCCAIKSSLSFMERFSFQRMVKGMQPSRCLAILGETLLPIPPSRICGEENSVLPERKEAA